MKTLKAIYFCLSSALFPVSNLLIQAQEITIHHTKAEKSHPFGDMISRTYSPSFFNALEYNTRRAELTNMFIVGSSILSYYYKPNQVYKLNGTWSLIPRKQDVSNKASGPLLVSTIYKDLEKPLLSFLKSEVDSMAKKQPALYTKEQQSVNSMIETLQGSIDGFSVDKSKYILYLFKNEHLFAIKMSDTVFHTFGNTDIK
jgi:hypothetical protein